MKTRLSHLNQKYDEEVEVGDSPELLKHILGDEVPKRVLEEDTKQSGSDWTIFKSTVFKHKLWSSKCFVFHYHERSCADPGPCVWE